MGTTLCAAPSNSCAILTNYHECMECIATPTWYRCAPPILFWPWPPFSFLSYYSAFCKYNDIFDDIANIALCCWYYGMLYWMLCIIIIIIIGWHFTERGLDCIPSPDPAQSGYEFSVTCTLPYHGRWGAVVTCNSTRIDGPGITGRHARVYTIHARVYSIQQKEFIRIIGISCLLINLYFEQWALCDLW